MIKRLRMQFALTFLAVLTLLLFFVLVLIYSSTALSLSRESRQTLRSLVLNDLELPHPDDPVEDARLPFFGVTLDENEKLLSVTGEYYDLSDKDALETLAREVLNKQALTGTLHDYHVRYAVTNDAAAGVRIYFLDNSNEEQTLSNLRRALGLSGAVGFLLLAVLSFFLSRVIVAPVESNIKKQQRFISDASHGLKTPLTVILTDAELLENSLQKDDERLALVAGIKTMGEQMKHLILGLLELEVMDRPDTKKLNEPVDFSAVVNEALLVTEPAFFENGMILEYKIKEGLHVSGDAGQLQRLPNILLSNAFKYAERPSTVKISLKDHNGNVVLIVDSAGRELTPEERSSIFQRFYRTDNARGVENGYGLGLSIAERITESHGGSIRAESGDRRNRFIIELPVLS